MECLFTKHLSAIGNFEFTEILAPHLHVQCISLKDAEFQVAHPLFIQKCQTFLDHFGVYDQQSALLFSCLQLANVVLLYLSQCYSCTTPIMATAAATIRGRPLIKLIMGIPYIAIYCDYNTVAILKDNNNTLFPAVHQCIVAILPNLNGLLPTCSQIPQYGNTFCSHAREGQETSTASKTGMPLSVLVLLQPAFICSIG